MTSQALGTMEFRTRKWELGAILPRTFHQPICLPTASLPRDFNTEPLRAHLPGLMPSVFPVTRRPSLGAMAGSALGPLHHHSLVILVLPARTGSLAPQDFCTCSLLSVKLTQATICNHLIVDVIIRFFPASGKLGPSSNLFNCSSSTFCPARSVLSISF